jgi:hypothetical protein
MAGTGEIMSFQSDVAKAANKMNTDMERVAEKVVTFWFSETIRVTPIDTGRLAGNWQVSKDSPASGEVGRTGRSGPLGDVDRVVQKLGNYWMVNNLPYAPVAEYGRWGTGPYATEKTTADGFSVQAPYGMARVSLVKTRANLRRFGVK